MDFLFRRASAGRNTQGFGGNDKPHLTILGMSSLFDFLNFLGYIGNVLLKWVA